jgi:hypothetical protein
MPILTVTLALVRAALLALQLALAVPIAYLCLLVVASLVAERARRRASSPPQGGEPPATRFSTRFAVLVPAHDEEALLGATLRSLRQQDYPRDRYEVVVIADNCTDRTSEIARAVPGIRVLERSDTPNRGKGQALRWALDQLEAAVHAFDAYVVVDADSQVDPALLAQFDLGIARGARALQAHYTVLNAEEAPSAALRWFSLALRNHVVPYGRSTLGGSAQLLGNGMCFTRALLERHPWRAGALAEDLQYYLTLVQAGERVEYVPSASVCGYMPTSFGQMRTQDIRWESTLPEGEGLRASWRLLRDGLRLGDWVRLEAFAARLVPPLSTTVAAWLLTTLAALLLRSPAQALLGAALGCGLLVYVGSAFLFERPPRMLWRAFLSVPSFALWKLWVVLVLSHSKKHTGAWIRSPRPRLAQASAHVDGESKGATI